MKKLKKDVGDKHNESIKYLRQLLPLPKCVEEVIVTEQYGQYQLLINLVLTMH